MFIFLDESGTFLHSPERDSWCVVTAYVTPEYQRRRVDALMLRVRRIGNNGEETKLKHLSEQQYVWFLSELNKLGGVAFAVAAALSEMGIAGIQTGQRNPNNGKILRTFSILTINAGDHEFMREITPPEQNRMVPILKVEHYDASLAAPSQDHLQFPTELMQIAQQLLDSSEALG